jgi:iron-sulfur cluster insertion protein
MTQLATQETAQPVQDLAEPPTPLVFTDSAAAKVADLIAEEGNDNLKLRVYILNRCKLNKITSIES